MALDRDRIAKNFSVSRRGYDPAEVDAHLAALADEIEELKRSSRERNDTLAATASEQVRAIVEAAEASAAEIHRDAEKEAQEIRGEASAQARAARGEARVQAREYLVKVSESTATMLERLEAMQRDLTALIDSVRSGATRLHSTLRELENSLGQVREAAEPAAPVERESPAPVGATAEAEPQDTQVQASSETVQVDALAGDRDDARLIALNMALGGSAREEVERYLAQNFELEDRRALVDEVYATVER